MVTPRDQYPVDSGLPEVSRRRALLNATGAGLAWFPLILLAILVGNTVASTLVLHTRHPTPAQFQVLTLYTDIAMLIFSGLFCFLLAPVLFKVSRGAYRQYLQEIGVIGGSWQAMAATAALVALVAILIVVLAPATVWRVDVPAWIDLAQPPLVEETLFRGLVLALLLKRFPAWFAVGWAAILFVPPHLFEGLALALGTGLVFGVTQGVLRLRTRSIWPGVVAHYAFVSGIGSPIFFAYLLVLAGLLLEWGVRTAVQRKG